MAETVSPPPRSNLIEVANKLLTPFMLNDWVADEHGTLFNQRIDYFYGGEDMLEKMAKHLANNFVALEYFKSAGAVDFTAEHNKKDRLTPWTVHVTAVNHGKFFALLENESLQLVGDKIVEQLPINLFPLPPVKQRVGNDFTIHTNGSISYRGRLIEMESAQAKVAAVIMAASVSGQWLSTESIGTLSGSVRITKVISEIKKIFQNATQKPEHNFFPNSRMLGYTFRPN